MEPQFGFREHAHTADWELEAWAPDLPTLLEQAARGMYALSGLRLTGEPRHQQLLTLSAKDPESLLVQFLSNLLWIEENNHLGFDRFDIEITQDIAYNLHAQCYGSVMSGMDKEIKAVTYHNLAIHTTTLGLHVNIVFDV